MSIIVNDFPKNAEYWRTVDGFPAYEISSDGRVRIIKTGKMMKFKVAKSGHFRVGLTMDKKQSFILIHRLVATAFCNRDEGCNIVDHIDRNPANNNYQNLRWTTISGNGRNRKIAKNNTSGHQGVTFNKRDDHWVANWYDDDLKIQKKSFSVKKLVDKTAKQLAINYRKQMEDENDYLNV